MNSAVTCPCDRGIAIASRPSGGPSSSLPTLVATILGSSVAFIDGSVVNVALPTIQHDLAANAGELSWTINAYLLPLGALILLGGGAGDRFGRRRLFQIGLGVFTLASVACALAPGIAWLLCGRGLQGVGAAMLMPNSLAILGATFAGEQRGRAVGIWAAVGALAGAAGPLLGGWIVDVVNWRVIFLLNVPLAGAAAYLSWRYVAESRDTHLTGHLDWVGAMLATLSLALLTWALSAVSNGHSAPLLIAATSAGVMLLCAFVWVEARRGESAIMPLAMFETRSFAGLTMFTFLLYGSLGGLLVLVPFLLIKAAGTSALAAGAALIPVPLLVGVGSPLMGGLTGRYGGRWPLTIGAGIVATGLLLLGAAHVKKLDYWTEILPPLSLIGLGLAISVAPLTTTVMASVAPDHVGTASGFNSAVARIAGLVATALLGFVFVQTTNDGLVAAFRIASIAGAACALIAAGSAYWLIPGKVLHQEAAG